MPKERQTIVHRWSVRFSQDPALNQAAHVFCISPQWEQMDLTIQKLLQGRAEDPELSWKALREYFSPSLNYSVTPMAEGSLALQINPKPPCHCVQADQVLIWRKKCKNRCHLGGWGQGQVQWVGLWHWLVGYPATLWHLLTTKVSHKLIPSSICFLWYFYHTLNNRHINILL